MGGSTEREYDLTFHDNGMIESAGNTFFNEKGLPEKVETGGQYPGTYTFEYEYDDDENVISALVDFTDIHGEYSTQTRLVFEYEPSIMVSRRTQSAWICFCLNVYCEAREVYKDILGIG